MRLAAACSREPPDARLRERIPVSSDPDPEQATPALPDELLRERQLRDQSGWAVSDQLRRSGRVRNAGRSRRYSGVIGPLYAVCGTAPGPRSGCVPGQAVAWLCALQEAS